jgi:hypothetical protein
MRQGWLSMSADQAWFERAEILFQKFATLIFKVNANHLDPRFYLRINRRGERSDRDCPQKDERTSRRVD